MLDLTPLGSLLSLALLAPAPSPQSCPSKPALVPIGSGTAGTGGVPSLVSEGLPLIQQPFRLRATDALPGSVGFLLWSSGELPIFLAEFGATLHPAAPFDFAILPLDPGGSSPAVGVGSVPPSFCGTELVAQFLAIDPVATGGVAFTQALRVTFGGVWGALFPEARFLVEGWPQRITSADLDLDGAPDLVTANTLSGEVSVMLGTGDGTFSEPQYVDGGGNARQVVCADMNQDGAPELVVANGAVGTVSVLIGAGDGTFAAPLSFAAGAWIDSVAVADFNFDGALDVVVENDPSSVANDTIVVFLGAGDGTLGPPDSIPLLSPSAVTAVDVSGNGVPDIVVGTSGDSVSVLRGNGDGTFAAPLDFETDLVPQSVAVSDLNADGWPDLLVANENFFGGNNGKVSVLLGAAHLNFSAPTNYAAGGHPNLVVAADVNLDGVPDMVVNADSNVGATTLGGLWVWIGDGDGTFSDQQRYGTLTRTAGLVVEDLNLDGSLDVAQASRSDGVAVLLGRNGKFVDIPSYSTGDNSECVAAADFDQDGIVDLVVVNADSDDVSVLLGIGDGSFGPSSNLAAGNHPNFVAAADLDEDGAPDFAVASRSSDEVLIYFGVGDGTFGAAQSVAAGDEPYALAIEDMDQDGLLDLVVVNRSSDALSVHIATGAGSFAAPQFFPVGDWPYGLAIADLNQDTVPDVVVPNASSSNVSVLLGVGDGSLEPQELLLAGDAPRSVAIADLDQDGFQDLAVGNYTNSVDNDISLLFGLGDGSFGPAQSVAEGSDAFAIVVEDLNVDGVPDLVFPDLFADNVGLLTGNSDGSFEAKRVFGSGPLSPSIVVEDLNGDGLKDVAVACHDGLYVLLNQIL